MAGLQPIKIDKLGVYGVIREAEVDSSLIPEGALTESINFHFDRKGAATSRPGITALGATVLTARPAVGLHNAQQGTALAVFSNGGSSTIYSFGTSSASGAWAVSLDGGTASVRIRFVDFAGYTIALNFVYNTYSSMRFWDGGTRNWKSTGNPINPQNMWGVAPQFGEVFKSRVYTFGDTVPVGSGQVVSNGSRLHFSSVISSTGNITWNPGTDYVDINPGDGERGTGLKRYSLELLCYKPNYIYRFRTSGVDPDPIIKVGTRSNESIVEGERGLYFHHDTGFYRYNGGYPTKISRPINDYIKAIPFSQYSNVVGWNDSDHIYWAVGTITVQETKEAVTIKNCVLRYTESSDIWTAYSMAWDVRAGMSYNNGSTLTRLVATDMGHVATQDSGTTDLGEPIKYRMRTKWYWWDSIMTRKVIEEIGAVCEKAMATNLMYQIDEQTEWKTIGTLSKLSSYFQRQNIRFNKVRFQVTGVNRNDSAIFRSIEILEGTNEGLVADPSN